MSFTSKPDKSPRKTPQKATPKVSGKAPKASGKPHKSHFYDPERKLHTVMPYILVITGLAFGICLVACRLSANAGGVLGQFLSGGLGALFSGGVYLIPILICLHGFMWRRDVAKHIVFLRIFSSFVFTLMVSALLQVVSSPISDLTFSVASFMENGSDMMGGGLFGAMLAYGLHHLVGEVCLWIILLLSILLYVCSYINVKSIVASFAVKPTSDTPKEKQKKPSLLAKWRLMRELKKSQDSYYPGVTHEESFESIRRRMSKQKRKEKKGATPKSTPSAPAPQATSTPQPTPTSPKPSERPSPDFYRVFPDDLPRSTTPAQTPSTPAKNPSGRRALDIDVYAPTSVQDAPSRPASTTPPSTKRPPEAPAAEKATKTPPPSPAPVVTDVPSRNKIPVKSYEVKPASTPAPRPADTTYQYPGLHLLKAGTASIRDEATEEEIARNSEILVETLASFRVATHIVGISRGPRITRYEIMPDRGVKISSIISRTDDISLNLASAGIRIEAPIPGMSAVGVEVPNRVPSLVRIRDLFASEGFVSASSKTTVCLGSDVTGKPVFADIAKMPHLLIAGATGMGKSVCINAILISLLYKARPDEVKLILVDPKKVELNVYNDIPHLLVPVVTEPQAAAGALIWAVGEMERRFELIESACVRDIAGYNKYVAAHPEKGAPLPKIVIVIDELNDLMMSARDAVEAAICRIAQKARAAGMHLIIGTQRPSVDVITGLIKANIPSRIAFHVSSMVDSRTILDMAGAEKLLDKGDMLASLVGLSEPRRVQGSMVEDEEVELVTSFLKKNAATAGSVYDSDVMESIQHETEKYKQSTQKRGEHEDDEEVDDDVWNDHKFRQVVELAVRSGKISTSLVQRELQLGYGRAARYIDMMMKMGIVSEPNGQKPRDVLITYEEYQEMIARAD